MQIQNVVPSPRSRRAPSGGSPLLIPTSDGFRIAATVFEPRERARGTVIVHGATAVPQAFYSSFADYLAGEGLRVVTYDYRGIGASKPSRLDGFQATLLDWALLDARSVHEQVGATWSEPVAFVGHSFGGQMIGILDELANTSGALLVGSQFGYHRHWDGVQSTALSVLWRAGVPLITELHGYLPGRYGLGADMPAGAAREWARWCASPGYLIDHVDGARERFARFDRPAVLYSFTDDWYAPEAAIAHFISAIPNAPLDHRRIDPRDLGVGEVGHFGFFRRRFSRTLFPEARAFLDAVLDGKKPPEADLAKTDPYGIAIRDVIADLEHGR